MSTVTKVKIIDTNSEEVLFECDMSDIESAYQRAAEFEEMGLDIRILAPTITQTLSDSLGIEHDELEEYEQSVVAEIHDHDGSCCAKPTIPDPEEKKLQ